MALAQMLKLRTLAQLLPVVKIPDFFSPDDIRAVRRLRDEHALTHGPAPLARQGWRTTYVSANGLFAGREPVLLERLSQLPWQLDVGHLAGGDSGALDELCHGLSVRCAEFHVGTPGGALRDPKHFDEGSLVTVDILLADNFEGGNLTTLEVTSSLFDMSCRCRHPFADIGVSCRQSHTGIELIRVIISLTGEWDV